MNKRRYMKKLLIQKFTGVVLLICCVLMMYVASTGVLMSDKDVTPVLLFAPLGLYLIFTKKIILEF